MPLCEVSISFHIMLNGVLIFILFFWKTIMLNSNNPIVSNVHKISLLHWICEVPHDDEISSDSNLYRVEGLD
jgi:hypothetical protein